MRPKKDANKIYALCAILGEDVVFVDATGCLTVSSLDR